jgi:hypothetical protein
MRALLDDRSAVQDDDPICAQHLREPVRDDESGAICDHGRGRLVQDLGLG